MHPALDSPMFSVLAPWLEQLPGGRFPACSELNALAGSRLASGGGVPVRFVEAETGSGEPYEIGVFRTGRVPTRTENWHDLFNALVWLGFPRTKAVLNRRHCDEILRRGGSTGSRGTARDVLTLFDEGGVIVASSERALLELLRRFLWKPLFWERRSQVLEYMRFFVFGHAILEKALQPYKSVTAKALLLEVPASFLQAPPAEQLADADARAASWFSAGDALLSTRNLAPLPVLGVPGWADNGVSDFYDDPEVFRRGYPNVQGKAGTVGSSP